MITLTVKKSKEVFVPVGEKDLISVVQKIDGWVTVIVDEDGYAKAQSKTMTEQEARKILQKAISTGIPEYVGKVRLV